MTNTWKKKRIFDKFGFCHMNEELIDPVKFVVLVFDQIKAINNLTSNY